MEIQEQLLKFKFHIIFGIISSMSMSMIYVVAPNFFDLIAYFWPLFASTALFLVVILLFSRVTPDAPGDKAAEGLLDYVTGQQDAAAAIQSFKDDRAEPSRAESS